MTKDNMTKVIDGVRDLRYETSNVVAPIDSRQCYALLCGLIGPLATMAGVDTVREELERVLECEQLWSAIKAMTPGGKQ